MQSCLPQSKVVYWDYFFHSCITICFLRISNWFFLPLFVFPIFKIFPSSWSQHMFYQEPVTSSVGSILVLSFSCFYLLQFLNCSGRWGDCTYFCDRILFPSVQMLSFSLWHSDPLICDYLFPLANVQCWAAKRAQT